MSTRRGHTNGAQTKNFYNLDDPDQGIHRDLAPGLSTRIFVGDQSMLSVVTIEPFAVGEVHSHPQEQWGILLDGDGVRIQDGEETAIKAGDFWLTPGGTPHGIRAGANGARVLDVFSPPRDEYAKGGAGFA